MDDVIRELERVIEMLRDSLYKGEAYGLDHGVGHFRLLSITRQRHYGIAMSHEGLCQVF